MVFLSYTKIRPQIPSRQRRQLRDKILPDFDDEEPEPLAVTNDLPVPAKTKQVQLLSPQKEDLSR